MLDVCYACLVLVRGLQHLDSKKRKRSGLLSKVNTARGVTKSTHDKSRASELMKAPPNKKNMGKPLLGRTK